MTKLNELPAEVNNAAPTRPPLSAELLAQAVSIERGMSFSLTTDDTISAAHSSDTHHFIVTWSKTETAKDNKK